MKLIKADEIYAIKTMETFLNVSFFKKCTC